MLRCLVSAKGLSRPSAQIIISRSGLTGTDLDEGTHHFSVFLISDANDRG
jgi:hypothetical protein